MIKTPVRYIFLLLFFFSSCKKPTPLDYRSNICGSWYFEVSSSSFNMVNPGSNSNSYSQYNGSISINKNNILTNDSLININYLNNVSLQLKLNNDWTLDFGGNYYSNGKFTGFDSLHIYMYSGGLGGGTSTSISGKKLHGSFYL